MRDLAVVLGRDVVDVSRGAFAVWQTLSDVRARERGDREVALLFTDLVDFSRWALRAGDRSAVRLLQEAGEAVEGAVVDHRGTVVKRLGDGVMADFDDPAEALRAALEARERLLAVEVDGFCPAMRAGVHWGRPQRHGRDWLGVDVNIAARVGDAAKSGQLLASAPACESVDPTEFRLGRARRLRSKGAPPDLRVREVQRADR